MCYMSMALLKFLCPVPAFSKWIVRIVRFMFAWELFAYCWSPNRLVFMKSPYHRIKFIAWGRHHVVYAFTKQFHEIKYHRNLLPTKIFNYLVVQKSAKFYTLENFTYAVYQFLTFDKNSRIKFSKLSKKPRNPWNWSHQNFPAIRYS